ncbi:MAG TPA: bifunctional (p)ppGpp synthetase/guanosine-3',5'-bis(diphosphate) 3'-pyrophosphohydrolase, partial [Fimbriimonadaceae bacterium]|nr:bifunctional (p)ppGpp synthetase/guanosine-3',5'-bis(diphosphate) 3'-pyrophosphohydrolase [Fimbriimonadaceae bacterium]
MALPSNKDGSQKVPEDLKYLLDQVRDRMTSADLETISDAYMLAQRAHEGQKRSSGEPYLGHPVEVAKIVVELHMDAQTVAAALLHDVLEDTEVTAEQIEKEFGKDVLMLVEGVTKLRLHVDPAMSPRQKAAAESARSAESLRKMLLAMAQDVRVMVIKLADRLHNMRTIDALEKERRDRIASETIDVYAPLAARLGIWQIKWQLEDLAFKVLHPTEFQRISEMVAKTRGEREGQVEEATAMLRKRLDERGMKHVEINGRPKHLFSIYTKIAKQGVPFEEIYDLLAVRVIVQDTAECYAVLGLVHELWLPIPGLFYDYIAMPKPNGYQSLHTKVIGPGGDPLEVQIRTRAMHDVAEYGFAAHWSYKEGKDRAEHAEKLARLRSHLFDWSTDARMSSDFLRSVTTDLFSEQVFVFTPKGDVLDLPKDSTPIDFAFRVHSELGLKVVGAKVNGIMVPLNAKLQNGDVVEMITRQSGQPSLDWLEFVKSQNARSKLRSYFRKRNRAESEERGREALEKEMKSRGFDPKLVVNEEYLTKVSAKLRACSSAADVYARVGEGLVSVQNVANKITALLRAEEPEPLLQKATKPHQPTVITSGIDNVMLRRAKCCMPLPEEDVVGYVTRGRGIMIHRRVCPNALWMIESEPERVTPLQWPADGSKYPVNLRIVTVDRQGLLMDITTIFSEAKADVTAAKIRTLPNNTAEINVTIAVRDAKNLQDVMNKVNQ